jgi:hypothetical protein
MTVAGDFDLASGIVAIVAAVLLIVVDHAVAGWMRAFFLWTGHIQSPDKSI